MNENLLKTSSADVLSSSEKLRKTSGGVAFTLYPHLPLLYVRGLAQFYVFKIICQSPSHRFHSHSLLNAETIGCQRVNQKGIFDIWDNYIGDRLIRAPTGHTIVSVLTGNPYFKKQVYFPPKKLNVVEHFFPRTNETVFYIRLSVLSGFPQSRVPLHIKETVMIGMARKHEYENAYGNAKNAAKKSPPGFVCYSQVKCFILFPTIVITAVLLIIVFHYYFTLF